MTSVRSGNTVRRTTGIGSLPHHNVDAALAFSFRMGIPFLPQIPIRNPWEFMIAQALEGLPGLQADTDGSVSLNIGIWQSRAHELGKKLEQAFARAAEDRAAFAAFEPSASTSSSWQPFLWELSERSVSQAKVQIAGPITSQWALLLRAAHQDQVAEPAPRLDRYPELSTQIFRLVLARALAMTRRLQSEGIQPLLYLDEPGLYALSASNPRHLLALQELKLIIQTLRKEGVQVGIHCCSNTDWNTVLGLGLDLLSVDTALSLGSLLSGSPTGTTDSLKRFVESGGRLSLGVIPTGRSAMLHSLDPHELFAQLLETFSKPWGSEPELVRRALSTAIFTPACGLALQSIADAELILEALTEFHDFCSRSLGG